MQTVHHSIADQTAHVHELARRRAHTLRDASIADFLRHASFSNIRWTPIVRSTHLFFGV